MVRMRGNLTIVGRDYCIGGAMKLPDIRAIVSGGASGLGYAVAERICAAGGRAVLLDLHSGALTAAVAALGSGASGIVADVTDEAQLVPAIAQARATMGCINLTVNCAGIAAVARLLGRDRPMSTQFFRHVIDVNLLGTLQLCRESALAMQANAPGADGERGLIVMTASIAAFDGQIGQVAYAASKGAIVAMTLPMARELAAFGIRVMSIAPGIFRTPMLASLSEQTRAGLAGQVPFPARLGEPHEFASLVAHLAENTMLNGEVIRLDGALRMAPR
jgi:NAD(P)-dependent dehydrogenase (short-subunit alcohol dehydrogenase family)